MHRFLDLSAVQTLGWVTLSPSAKIEAVEGYESATYLFKNSSDESSKNIAKTTLCSGDEATRTQSFKQIYILSIADILSNVLADPEVNFDVQKELFLKSLNQAMIQTESVAPILSTKVSGVVGISHRSLISGSVILKHGDSVLGTGAFQGTDSGLVNSADVSFTAASVPEITSDSVFQAEISGNLTLKCYSEQGTQTAAAIIGNPSLAWFIKPMIDEKQTP